MEREYSPLSDSAYQGRQHYCESGLLHDSVLGDCLQERLVLQQGPLPFCVCYDDGISERSLRVGQGPMTGMELWFEMMFVPLLFYLSCSFNMVANVIIIKQKRG